MVTVALYVRLEAKPGKDGQLLATADVESHALGCCGRESQLLLGTTLALHVRRAAREDQNRREESQF